MSEKSEINITLSEHFWLAQFLDARIAFKLRIISWPKNTPSEIAHKNSSSLVSGVR